MFGGEEKERSKHIYLSSSRRVLSRVSGEIRTKNPGQTAALFLIAFVLALNSGKEKEPSPDPLKEPVAEMTQQEAEEKAKGSTAITPGTSIFIEKTYEPGKRIMDTYELRYDDRSNTYGQYLIAEIVTLCDGSDLVDLATDFRVSGQPTVSRWGGHGACYKDHTVNPEDFGDELKSDKPSPPDNKVPSPPDGLSPVQNFAHGYSEVL